VVVINSYLTVFLLLINSFMFTPATAKISYNKFIKLQPFIIVLVDVLATAAAFV